MRCRGRWRLGIAITMLAVGLALAAGAATAGGGNRVRAVNKDFKPQAITINKGQRVTWKRVEGTHTVTFKNGSFDKALDRSHPRRSRAFRKRGTFRYFCRPHRDDGMKGKVIVK